MIQERLFGPTPIPLLKKGLDSYALRHRAISDNVANTETTGYRRKKVLFEEKLRQVMKLDGLRRTHPMHMGLGGIRLQKLDPELVYDPEPTDINALNNVDIDREMAEMARNHLQYSFAGKLIKQRFEGINTSIRGM